MWDNDALGAAIEHPAGVKMLFAGHAHDRGTAHIKRRHAHLAHHIDIVGGVLHIRLDPIIAAGIGDFGDIGGA